MLRAVSLPGDVFTNNVIGIMVELPAMALGAHRAIFLLFLFESSQGHSVCSLASNCDRLMIILQSFRYHGAYYSLVNNTSIMSQCHNYGHQLCHKHVSVMYPQWFNVLFKTSRVN